METFQPMENRDIEKEIEDILRSFEGRKDVTPTSGLHDRVMGNLNQKVQTTELSRWALVGLAANVLLALANIYSLYEVSSPSPDIQVEETYTINDLQSDFGITDTYAFYDFEEIE